MEAARLSLSLKSTILPSEILTSLAASLFPWTLKESIPPSPVKSALTVYVLTPVELSVDSLTVTWLPAATFVWALATSDTLFSWSSVAARPDT